MDYYEILGVNRNATSDDIAKAYRKMAFKYHPDQCKSASAADKFKLVNEAYCTLIDVNKRAIYNSRLPKVRVKPVKKTKSMTDSERYAYYKSNDPNLNGSSKEVVIPPKFDIWGKPLSLEEQKQWIIDNTRETIVYYSPKKKQYTPPPQTRSSSHFVDVFEKYYEKNSQPDLR